MQKKEDEIRREEKLPKLPGMGATGVAETSTTCIEETKVVGTAETGTEGVAGTGSRSAAGAVIPTAATISGPSEVSASGEISMQIQKKKDKGKRMHTHKIKLRRSAPLFIRVRNSLFHHGCIIKILKDIIGSL